MRLRYLSSLSSANVVSKPQWIYVVTIPLVSPHAWPRFSKHELHLMPILPSTAICTMLADCTPVLTPLSTTIRPAPSMLTGGQANSSWQLPTYLWRSLAQPPAESRIRWDKAAMNHISYSTHPQWFCFCCPTQGLNYQAHANWHQISTCTSAPANPTNLAAFLHYRIILFSLISSAIFFCPSA